MLKNGKRIKVSRRYSESLKKEIVTLYESGQRTVLELTQEYSIKKSTNYKWIYKYSQYNEKSIQIVEVKNSQQEKIKQLEEKVKDLERIVDQKQINIDFLEKMIDLAKEEWLENIVSMKKT